MVAATWITEQVTTETWETATTAEEAAQAGNKPKNHKRKHEQLRNNLLQMWPSLFTFTSLDA
jgi:hypothetical protein